MSRETGAARSTIRRLLADSEVRALVASYRDAMLDLVPAAIRLCARKLKGTQASWQLAIEILKGTQVLVSRTQQDQHHVVDEIETLSDDELRAYIRALLGGCPDDWAGDDSPGLSITCDQRRSVYRR